MKALVLLAAMDASSSAPNSSTSSIRSIGNRCRVQLFEDLREAGGQVLTDDEAPAAAGAVEVDEGHLDESELVETDGAAWSPRSAGHEGADVGGQLGDRRAERRSGSRGRRCRR